MKNLFRIKSIEYLLKEASAHEYGDSHSKPLKRTLTATSLVLLGVGGIIGAGIFVLTGQAAAQYAGPSIVISFILSGIACVFAGLCYAEFASLIPIAGSAYTYAYATIGEFLAWIIGWDLILEYMFGASTVAVGWSGYVVSFCRDLGLNIPVQITAATGSKLIEIPGEGWRVITNDLLTSLTAKGINPETLAHSTALINLPAVLIVAFCTYMLYLGMKESAIFNNIIVVLKVSVILLFIALGSGYIQIQNWTPFIPENQGTFGAFGYSGILRGAGVIFFAYLGFDALSTAAQETKNPQRDMPIGILASLTICTILYIIVSLVLTGIVKYTHLMVPDPIAVAVDAAGPGLAWIRPLIKIGAIAGLSSVVLVLLMGQPRIFYSMSKDGLLPQIFSKVHKKHQTPYVTTIMTGIGAAIIAGVLPINILGELVSIGTLFAFAIVCIGVLVLRYKRPDLHRPFKTPFVPAIPILGALGAFAQMCWLPLDTWLRLIIWLAIGLVIYFFYGRKKSHLNKK